MKEITALYLAVFFLAVSGRPCSEGVGNTDNRMTIRVQDENHEESCADRCSPMDGCACCSHYCICFYIKKMPLHFYFTTYRPASTDVPISLYNSRIFQPPRG
ncbi:MAG TPA: hypothetical protein PKJ64_10740 [bacterium]|nr:hypothetical protein [bacterium]